VVDTVRLLVGAGPTGDQLEAYWDWNLTQPAGGEPTYKYYHNPKLEGFTLPRFTYHPSSYLGTKQISVEVSLPKLIFGNNYELLSEVGPALDRLDEIIDADPAIPPLPSMADASLSRLDLCCHYSVGDLLPHYITALAALNYPHRDTVRFNAETVEFRTKSVKTKFYDKHAETDGEAPPGTLRHEITYHQGRVIKEAFAADRAVLAGALTPHMAELLLTKDHERLGILDKPFPTSSSASRALIDQYGSIRGARLFGILAMLGDAGPEGVAERLNLTRKSVIRDLATIRKADIAASLTDAKHDLPPLKVSLPRTSSPTRTCTQTPGVTQGSLADAARADEVTDDDDH